MLEFFVRRFVAVLPTLVGMTLVTFLIVHFIPAEPLAAILGQRALSNPEIVEHYRRKWGLDKSVVEQYLIYMRNLLQGDMGISIRSQRPVTKDLSEFLPATIEMAGGALTLAIGGGILLGMIGAFWNHTWVDEIIRVVALIGSSMPVFWMALIFLQVFYAGLGWLPGPGRLDSGLSPPPRVTGLYVLDGLLARDWQATWSAIKHLLLPCVVLGWYQMGLIARITRASMLEALRGDYVRTARAKGVRERWIVFRHAFPNAVLPVLTMIGLAVAGLLAGAVQTETIFAWPGIGRYAASSAETMDFPAVMGVTILISLLFVGTNLIVDLLYGVVDPRIGS